MAATQAMKPRLRMKISVILVRILTLSCQIMGTGRRAKATSVAMLTAKEGVSMESGVPGLGMRQTAVEEPDGCEYGDCKAFCIPSPQWRGSLSEIPSGFHGETLEDERPNAGEREDDEEA